MKNKIILILSGLIVANTVLGNVGGEEDVFETKEDVFGSNEAQLVHQETTTTNNEIKEEPTLANEELKVQVIPDWGSFYGNNGFVIKKGMDQYIIEGVIYKADIERVLVKLRPLYTDKDKKLGLHPIVFKQIGIFEPSDIPTEESDEFSIEGFVVGQWINNINYFEEFYNPLIKYDKPIVFEGVGLGLKDEIEKRYGLSKCQIAYNAFIESFDDYLKVKKLGIENLKIKIANIDPEFIPANEFKKQLSSYVRDNQVYDIYIMNSTYKGTKIPIEYLYYVGDKISFVEKIVPVFNSQDIEDTVFIANKNLSDCYLQNIACDTLFCEALPEIGKNVSCKNIVSPDFPDKLSYFNKINNLEAVWLGFSSEDFDDIKKGIGGWKEEWKEEWKEIIEYFTKKNISLRLYNEERANKLFDACKEYIEEKDIMYLFGYVNAKNKPEELSDKEWKQVLILKQKVKEFIKKIQFESIEAPAINPVSD